MNRDDFICGVDEVGRGPLAGPVTAAAVILDQEFPVHLLADSKALSPAKRDIICKLITQKALAFAIGWVWSEEIDTINIHNASLLAMKRSITSLSISPSLVLVDGKFIPPVTHRCRAIIKGDSKEASIMAASILAKVVRDRWMVRYSWIDCRYGFEKHKGYPTKDHRRMIFKYGLSAIHRHSFRISPVS